MLQCYPGRWWPPLWSSRFKIFLNSENYLFFWSILIKSFELVTTGPLHWPTERRINIWQLLPGHWDQSVMKLSGSQKASRSPQPNPGAELLLISNIRPPCLYNSAFSWGNFLIKPILRLRQRQQNCHKGWYWSIRCRKSLWRTGVFVFQVDAVNSVGWNTIPTRRWNTRTTQKVKR